jgi:GH43 family beta-xylosidase
MLMTAFVLAGCGGGADTALPGAGSGLSQASGLPDPAPPAPPSPPPSLGGETTFTNPLLASGPDPYVIRHDGTYYYTHTLGSRIGVWATPAMSRLAQARYVTIFVPPPAGPNSHDLWAPELHFLDGRWYAYYAAGDGTKTPNDPFPSQRMFVLENDHSDPTTGTWVDRGRLAGPDQDAWAIDGTVLEHAGQRYFVWSGRASADDPDQRIYIARMQNPWTLAGGRVLLSSPDRAWERAGRIGVNEGPQVLRNPAGDVFLVYSANGCWTDDYALGMLTLRTGGDPLDAADWVKSDRPVFVGNAANGAYGPGHNGFFTSADGTETWLVYHANATSGRGCGDARTPRMQPLRWRADGTPDFGTPAPVGRPLPVPSGEAAGP